MRKKLIIPIMLGLCLLASCGQDTKAEKTNDTAVTTTEATTSATDTAAATTIKTTTTAAKTTASITASTAPAATEKATEQQPETEAATDPNEEDKKILKAINVLKDSYRYFYMDGTENGTFEHRDTDGDLIDFKNLESYMVYEAENLPIDRELGSIADEQDLIEKARYVLLNGKGQEYMDWLEDEPDSGDGAIYIRDNPSVKAEYYDEYDTWYIYPTSPTWTREDGTGPHIVAWSEGPRFMCIRGSDGRLLGSCIRY